MEVGFPTSSALGRYGLGFNRRTWNLGRSVGNLAKKGIKSYFSNRKRKSSAPPAARRLAKRSKSTMRGYQAPTGGGDSKSSFTLVKPMQGKASEVSKELEPSYVVNNSSGRQEATIGKQNFVLVGDYFTSQDINQGFTLLNTVATAKILLQSVRGETLITNQENVNGRFTIYDIICRKETDATVTDPYAAITTGFADASSGNINDYLVPGASPFANARFTEYFKVLQSTEVILSPGACHSHVVTYKPNKYFSHELSSRVAGGGIGELTIYTLVQFHGTPVNDLTTQTQVSLSHIAMDYVQKEEYKYSYLHQSSATHNIVQTIPTAFTVAANVMEDDGVARAGAEA